MANDNGRTRMPQMPITVGQAGEALVKYWQILVVVAILIASGAVSQFQIYQHGEAIEKIGAKLDTEVEKIEAKLDERANETAQWDLMMAIGTEVKGNSTRLDGVEEHVTPDAIQAWGAFKASVTRIDENLTAHVRNRGIHGN